MCVCVCVCVSVCVCVCVSVHMCTHAHAKSLQLCLTLCKPMDPPGSSVHGILQARILEWAAIPLYGESSNPGIASASLMSPALAGRLFSTSATWKALV